MKCCPYTQHYVRQAGGNHIPVFYGRTDQRGHGIGSLFGSLARSALPFFKSAAGYVGRNLLSTGANVIGDVLQGRNVGEAFKERFTETGRDVLSDVGSRLQQQSGRGRKRKACSKKKKKKKGTKKRKVETIFD